MRRALPAFLLVMSALLFTACSTSIMPFMGPSASPSEERALVDTWLRTLEGKTVQEQGQLATQAWKDPRQSAAVKQRAMYLVATRPGAESFAAQQELARIYKAAATGEKANMEALLMADVNTADNNTLGILAAVPRDQEATFPWSVFVWQASNRGLYPDAANALNRLSMPGIFANPMLFGLGGMPPASGMAGSVCVALLLPLDGPYAGIAKQISMGAQAAGAALATGIPPSQPSIVDLRIINTESPTWKTDLQGLPPACGIVGGPLRADTYTQLMADGGTAIQGRALFAFLPQLPNAQDEGQKAWRFFTSPQDQIDAVLNFTTTMGITDFGALYPGGDAYSERMVRLFSQDVAKRGGSVQTDTYAAGDMASWTKSTASFVGSAGGGGGVSQSAPRASAPFKAIFLPDSWKNMDMLISVLRYHGAHDRIMMGTSLWEQSLVRQAGVNPETYSLTIFPGAWDSLSPTSVRLNDFFLEKGGLPDSWAALGYDFVMFAASLGLQSPVQPYALNQRLARGFDIEWAGAPFRFDSQGKAFRDLIIFQPAKGGMVRLDPEAFNLYYQGRGNQLPNALVNNSSVLQDALDSLAPAVPVAPAGTTPAAATTPATPAAPAQPVTVPPAGQPAQPAQQAQQAQPVVEPPAGQPITQPVTQPATPRPMHTVPNMLNQPVQAVPRTAQ